MAVRRGDGTRAPLMLANGIGASLEVLEPFVEALDLPFRLGDWLGESVGQAVADVGGERRGQDLQLQRRYAVEEAFARTEGYRCDVGAQLVDESGGEVLVDRGGTAGDGDVAISRTLRHTGDRSRRGGTTCHRRLKVTIG